MTKLGNIMDLATIAQRTGLSARRLRYVVDHGVLPGGKVIAVGRGNARSYTDFEAFGIALAAVLLDAGIKRRIVALLLERLCDSPKGSRRERPALLSAFSNARTMSLEIGDGVNFRMHVTTFKAGPEDVASWTQAGTGAQLATGYAPLVRLIIDVGHIRSAIKRDS